MGSSPLRGLPAVETLLRHPLVARVAAACHGVEAHLVGGMIRDTWLGRPCHDVDVIVAGGGREIAGRLAEDLPAHFVPLGGKEFAAFRLVGEGFEVDVWDREPMSLGQDLARRDFTINAVAIDLAQPGREGLADPHGGLGDLQRRRLRATTRRSFTDDPLRVLRLARFAAELPGFTVEPATRELARASAATLAGVAVERVREEVARLLDASGAARGLEEMAAAGLFPGLLLGEPGMPANEQDRRTAEGVVSELEALPAAARSYRELAAEILLGRTPEPDLPAARLAVLMLHLPVEDPAGALRRLQRMGHIVRRRSEPSLPLVERPRLPPAGAGGESERRRFLHHVGRGWPTALVIARARAAAGGDAGGWEEPARELLDLVAREEEAILDPPRLLTGGEVRELLGIPAGPEVGRALAAVRQAQVDGRVRTREEAMAVVRDLGEMP